MDKVNNIKQLIKTYFEQSKHKQKYRAYLIKERWTKVMGLAVLGRTNEININDKGLLIVKISSPTLRHQIMLQKQDILTALNKTEGEKILSIAVL